MEHVPVSSPVEPLPPRRQHLAEVARLFARLGFIAFGGPAAHIALIEDEVVHRRRWLDRQHFLDLLSTINFIPGPNSTELVIHLGLLRAGAGGLIVAGACFILPAMLIILPIAWLYTTYGSLPQVQSLLVGVYAAMLAIVIAALWRFARAAILDLFTGVLLAVSILATLLAQRAGLHPDLYVLGAAALLGAFWYARPRWPLLAIFPLPLGVMTSVALTGGFWGQLTLMALQFLKIGATLFGSGYVLISYLQGSFVDHHAWLSRQQLFDAIAVGQVTPGPLLTTATFIGYLLGSTRFGGGLPGGILGGLIATFAIFLPSFIFISILGPFLPRLRRNPLGARCSQRRQCRRRRPDLCRRLAPGLDRPALDTWPNIHWPTTLLCLAIVLLTLLGPLLWKINATWLIFASAALGLLAHAVGLL